MRHGALLLLVLSCCASLTACTGGRELPSGGESSSRQPDASQMGADTGSVPTGCGDCDSGYRGSPGDAATPTDDGSAQSSSGGEGGCLVLSDPSQPIAGAQKTPGQACQNPAQCDSYSCVGGICPYPNCASAGSSCSKDIDCCDRGCSNGTCSGTPFCLARGSSCDAGTECLEGICTAGWCGKKGCTLGTGSPCTQDYDCCSLQCLEAGCSY